MPGRWFLRPSLASSSEGVLVSALVLVDLAPVLSSFEVGLAAADCSSRSSAPRADFFVSPCVEASLDALPSSDLLSGMRIAVLLALLRTSLCSCAARDSTARLETEASHTLAPLSKTHGLNYL